LGAFLPAIYATTGFLKSSSIIFWA